MSKENDLPSDAEVKAFQSLKTHAEKCEHFHANPNLARVFRASHFPKPDEAASAVSESVKLK